jgi:hypothetical protein
MPGVPGLTLTHFRNCSRVLISNTLCRGSFYVFSELKQDVIVRFVDIGGIIHHHCLNFLFLIL